MHISKFNEEYRKASSADNFNLVFLFVDDDDQKRSNAWEEYLLSEKSRKKITMYSWSMLSQYQKHIKKVTLNVYFSFLKKNSSIYLCLPLIQTRTNKNTLNCAQHIKYVTNLLRLSRRFFSKSKQKAVPKARRRGARKNG